MATVRIPTGSRDTVATTQSRRTPAGSRDIVTPIPKRTVIRPTYQAIKPTKQLPKPQTDMAFENTHIKLSTGEYVAIADFSTLTPADQSLLMSVGIDRFNREKRQQLQNEQQRFAAENIRLNTGEYVSLAEWSKLSQSDRELLKARGIDGFKAVKDAEYQKSAADFESFKASHTLIATTGEWVTNTDLGELTGEAKNQLLSRGIDGFNDWSKDKTIPQVYSNADWKPDFTSPNPYAGMPKWYARAEAAGFVPTVDNPLPPTQAMGITKEPYPLDVGHKTFDTLKASGDIPADAEYGGYDPITGKLSYNQTQPSAELPVERKLSATEAWAKAQSQGLVPVGAIFQSYNEQTGEITYQEPSESKPEQPMVSTTIPQYTSSTSLISDVARGLWNAQVNKVRNVFGPDNEPSQESLAARYEQEQKRPFWQKMLTGDTVLKDSKGKYSELRIGVMPDVGNKRGVASTIAINWDKVLQSAKIANAIRYADAEDAARILKASSEARYAQRAAQLAETVDASYEQAEMAKIATESARQARLYVESLDDAQFLSKPMPGKAPLPEVTSPLEPIRSIPIAVPSKTDVLRTITIPELQNATQVATIEYAKLIEAGVPQDLAQGQTLTVVANALQTGNYPSTTLKSVTELQLSADMQTLAIEATNNAVKLQPVIMEQVKAVSQTVPATSTVPVTDIVTKATTETTQQTVTETQAAQQTQTDTGTKVTTPTATDVNITQRDTDRIGGGESRSSRRIRIPNLAIKGTPEDKAAIASMKGVVEWRHGLYWKVIPPPYDKVYHFKEPLPGTHKFSTGEGSAYRTIQVLNGNPPEDMDLDIGIAIVHLRQSGKDVAIDFTQDASDAYRGRSVVERVQRHVEREPSQRSMGNSMNMSEIINGRGSDQKRKAKESQTVSPYDRFYMGRKLRPNLTASL